jgi:hypothetical protein
VASVSGRRRNSTDRLRPISAAKMAASQYNSRSTGNSIITPNGTTIASRRSTE